MVTTLTNAIEPDEKSAALARAALPRVKEYLRTHPDSPAVLRLVGESELPVPRGAVELFAAILAHMANGQGISVVPAQAELTTQQAADLLNVSRPHLIGLLESGKIDFRRVGTHRRVPAGAVVAYQQRKS